MSPANQILVTITLIVSVIVGLLVIDHFVSVKCFDFWPFKDKACVISTR